MRVNFWSIFLSSYGSLLIYSDSLIMMTIQPFSTIFSPWLLRLLALNLWPLPSEVSIISPHLFPTNHFPRHIPVFLEMWPTRTSASWPCLVSAWSHTCTNHLGQLPPWLPHLSTKTGLTEAVTPGVTRVGLLRINCPSFSAFPRDSSVHLSFPCL